MKFSTVFVLLFFLTTLNSQETIVLEEDSISQTHNNVDLSNLEHFVLWLYYKNNTNDSIFVNWRREFGDNCPIEWEAATLDQNQGHFINVNESPYPITMAPYDSSFFLGQDILPKTIGGCCDIKLIFSLEGSPNNPIDTGYYHLEINSSGCIETSIIEENIKNVNIYPNPSSNVLRIENNSLLESLELIDLTGKIYYKSSILVSSEIDISHFQSGLYICKTKSKMGDFLITKIIKQ